MQVKWQGVYPALLTPFTQDDRLDLLLFEKNLEAQVAAGVHGVIIGGSLGEASTLQFEEKRELVLLAKAKLRDTIPVILNIAEASTAEATALAKHAVSWVDVAPTDAI
jgi:4-hydroxy-tetrahydrodipicolinate synthase